MKLARYRVGLTGLAILIVLAAIFHTRLMEWFGGGSRGTSTPAMDHSAHANGGAAVATTAHAYAPAARTELERALAAYDEIRARLAADDAGRVAEPAQTVATALRAAANADPELPKQLAVHLADAAGAADSIGRAGDLEAARASFAGLSEHIVPLTAADPTIAAELHLFECPMTSGYNKWLQPEAKLANPYMGAEMLTCGSEVGFTGGDDSAEPAHEHEGDGSEIAHYTCPMDTWVKQKTPGKCPVCGMDLVPVTVEEVRTGVMRIDHRRRQLIGLKTGLVERRDLTLDIRAVGRVSYDETRLAEITLKYDGYIEKLLVDETGQKVRRGQTLFTVYSPELYNAQQEYLLALSQRDAGGEANRARGDALVRAARKRLELLDVTSGQLERIAAKGEPLQYVPVIAPASGYVVAKDVVEGSAIKRGQRLFRIAALDKVWVEADVYEKDIPLVKVGQDAHITLTHLPGRTFEGKVSFIYPYLDGETRTSRARIELANADMELKPDMYANVELHVPLGERLVVPEAAVIYSGPRRVVFLDMDKDRLRPMPIEVGVKSDGLFEVLKGLDEGDRVVTSGNFLLSAESRLKAATGLW